MSGSTENGLVRLWRLMTDPEKAELRLDLGLPADADDSAVLETIARLPKYEAVRAFLRAADATMVVLQEVFGIMARFGIAVKTTGCIFVLADPAETSKRTELAFSPQMVDAACRWSPRKQWTRVADRLSDLYRRWLSFRAIWARLLQAATPETEEPDYDPVEVSLGNLERDHEDRVDQDAQHVTYHFMTRLQNLAERLAAIPAKRFPEELGNMRQDLRRAEREFMQCFHDPRSRPNFRHWSTHPPAMRLIDHYVPRTFVRDFDAFVEDVYALSDLVEGEEIADMLRIDLWAARSQLYEIWVLLTVLQWLQGRGYSIELLKLDLPTEQTSRRWSLSYANEFKPCALVRGADDRNQFLFYQLRRPVGVMPDISLLGGPDPEAAPIWALDPKHSERSGYTFSDYATTATAYRDDFGAPLSVLVEFFPREDLRRPNPLEFSPGAKLIRDCRPAGAGLTLLLAELAAFHPSQGQVLVCIDYSGSFEIKRQDAIRVLVEGPHQPFAPECIGFAGSAAVLPWPPSTPTAGPPQLESGTKWPPLREAIIQAASKYKIRQVLLLSDGEFNDPIETILQSIRTDIQADASIIKS